MKIGLLGGTGNMGRGLSIRWAKKHEIFIGSRSQEKADRIAKELRDLARGFYQAEMQGHIEGKLNADAISMSEVVVITLPPKATVSALSDLKEHITPEHIVVSTVVPMSKKGRLFYFTPLEKENIIVPDVESAAEVVQEIVKPASVVSAFQTIPATYLNNIDALLNVDVLIAGNNELSITLVSKLVRDIPNLRPLRVGPLENSKWIESLTPLLLNAAILNGLHEPTIRVIPWMPE